MAAYRFSCERADQQPERIHAFLTRSYWAEGIGLDLVRRCIAGSLCCGAFAGDEQIGFARAVTDAATFAYLADVYVLEEHRGRRVAERMLQTLFAHPDLQGLRRMMLNTRDAHRLYRRFGFVETAHPERIMEIVRPGLYRRSRGAEPAALGEAGPA